MCYVGQISHVHISMLDMNFLAIKPVARRSITDNDNDDKYHTMDNSWSYSLLGIYAKWDYAILD